MRGLKKGALTIEQVNDLLGKWTDAKEAKIEARKTQVKADLAAFHKMVSGEAKPKAVVADEATKQAAEAFKVTADENTESAVAEVAENVAEVSEQVEETVEAVAEETAAEDTTSEPESPAADESDKTEE